ncbi:MAG TPA: protein kinase, partial [Gemmataceae bacterium]|nr:protein kinase [Gemmataceae bacterium]
MIPGDDYESLDPAARAALEQEADDAQVLASLVECRLLSEYQAGRVRAGRTHGLVLGNYRVLDRIGAGGMGVVYRGEHARLRQPVAIKALRGGPEQNARTLARFFQEARAVARLRHPNIVAAIDAGEEPGYGPDSPPVPYFVMELVPGKDLDRLVASGPLSVPFACHL